MARPLVSFTEASLREAVAASTSFSGTLRGLGLRAAGGNHRTMRKYIALWGISTEHFDRYARPEGQPRGRPLAEILVEHSTYANRRVLKQRLYAEGLKSRECELCGQGELWRGRRMSLVLDHVNGVHDDNRLENLRLVCPNCNATLETHCGRQLRKTFERRRCRRCDASFTPKYERQQYCSAACGARWDRRGRPIPGARRAERPSYEVLAAEVAATSYSAVARTYGVSDNAIRKWLRAYERELGPSGAQAA